MTTISPSGGARRATVVVLDACGVGELPDADEYGDAGSNTLGHLAPRVGGLRLPVLERLGLGSIIPLVGVSPAGSPVVHGRLRPLGPGKESVTGHWELMGVVPSAPLPTYPSGFAAPGRSYLEALQAAGAPVHGMGKINELFAGVGISESHPAPTNARGIEVTSSLLRSVGCGLIFVNLVETDQVYGHRHDVDGFHSALIAIDAAVGEWLGLLRDDDLLILCADHGVDPTAPHTDHTREYAPLLALWSGCSGVRHDGLLADVGASVLSWVAGRTEGRLVGESFV